MQRRHQCTILVTHNAQQLLFPLRHQEFLGIHGIETHRIDLSHRERHPRMKCDSQQTSRYCHMILGGIFTKILQGFQNSWLRMNFIQKHKGFAWHNIHPSQGRYTSDNPIHLKVGLKQFKHSYSLPTPYASHCPYSSTEHHPAMLSSATPWMPRNGSTD